jgi:hypothetical protein
VELFFCEILTLRTPTIYWVPFRESNEAWASLPGFEKEGGDSTMPAKKKKTTAKKATKKKK